MLKGEKVLACNCFPSPKRVIWDICHCYIMTMYLLGNTNGLIVHGRGNLGPIVRNCTFSCGKALLCRLVLL